jgi:hypothetical protein
MWFVWYNKSFLEVKSFYLWSPSYIFNRSRDEKGCGVTHRLSEYNPILHWTCNLTLPPPKIPPQPSSVTVCARMPGSLQVSSVPLCLSSCTGTAWTGCRVQLKCDGKRWRKEGKWKGNCRMEWVASTLTLPRNMVYPALLPLMRTTRLPVVDWTDAPADLNRLVHIAERRNLVSAPVPSHFNRSLPSFELHLLLVQHRLTLRPLFCFKTSRPTSGAQPTSSLGTGVLSWGKRGPWCDAEHSLSSSADVKNMRSHTSTPPAEFHVLGRNTFIFTLGLRKNNFWNI